MLVAGISVWVPVISTLAGGVLAGGVALLVSRLKHSYAPLAGAQHIATVAGHNLLTLVRKSLFVNVIRL